MKNFNYSWRQIAKASFIGIATTATFYLAKTTGLFSSWFLSEETSTGLADSKELLSLSSQQDLSFPRRGESIDAAQSLDPRFRENDELINAGQRRLLQQGAVTVVNPIPDQVIQVNQQYTYSLDNVFSGNYSLIGAMETGKNSLPSWLILQPKLLSTSVAGGVAQKVLVNGSIAFVADLISGLRIIDISNVNSPKLLSTHFYGTYELAIQGSTAFLACGTMLRIIDVSNTSNPLLLSTYLIAGGVAQGVEVSGNTTFVACGYAGLQILDVGNISKPLLLSNYSVRSFGASASASGVALNGTTAFVAIQVGLLILDVSNASFPQLLSSFYLGGSKVTISGYIAFVSAANSGLRILDVSNISNPRLVNTYPAGTGSTYQVAISGKIAFMANQINLQVLDISNISNLRLLSTFPAGAGFAYGVTARGNFVFLANGNVGLQILDISQANLIGVPPSSGVNQEVSITVGARDMNQELVNERFNLILDQLPKTITSTLSDQSISINQSITLSLSSGVLFINPGNSFLKLSVRLSNGGIAPTWLSLNLQPILLSTLLNGHPVRGVTINSSTAFVANGDAGLCIFDISQPTNPRQLSTFFDNTAFIQQAVSKGNLVFMAGVSRGLEIVDANNITNPQLLSNFSAQNGTAYGIAISGSTIFVADGNVGLQAIDMNIISSLRLLSIYPAGTGFAYGVAITDNVAFMACGFAGLQILDVSNATSPRLLSNFNVGGGEVRDVVISKGNAFVAYSTNGLKIIDINNVTSPQLLGSYPAGAGQAFGITVKGSTAFVADYTAGLLILDVSNTSNLRLLGVHPGGPGGKAWGTAISGNTAYLADDTAGLLILDLSQWQLTATPGPSDVGNYQLQLIATDELGGSASTQPFTIRVEGSPRFNNTIPTQYAKVGQAFNYFIPQGLVSDPNFDPITFSAKLANNQSLPSWLSFSGISAAFVGTPQSSHVGNLTIVLSATDNIAGSSNTSFILMTNNLPVVNQRLSNTFARVNQFFQLLIPNNTFSHPDGLVLNYSAQLSSQAALPSWLRFNATSLFLSGQPNATDAGGYDLRIMATDRYAGQASTSFTLSVGNGVQVNRLMNSQLAGVGLRYVFAVPSDSFMNPDGTAFSLQTGVLPSWLTFATTTAQFSGTPLAGSRGTSLINVTATDLTGGTAMQSFNLTVTYFPQVVSPIVDQIAPIGRPYQLAVSGSTFIDQNGYALTYRAEQSNGQFLPAWLNFNATTLQFFGLPNITQALRYSLDVIATNPLGAEGRDTFALYAEHYPTVQQPIPDAVAGVDQPLRLTISGSSFSDLDNDALRYNVTRADQSLLPNWLSFDAQALILSGTPLSAQLGNLTLLMTATDPSGGSAQQNFTIIVRYLPTLSQSVGPIAPVREGRLLNYTLPPGTFTDGNGATLYYNATQDSGASLPAWLNFNVFTQQFLGIPASSDVGALAVRVIADDGQGGQASVSFSFTITPNYPPVLSKPVSNSVASVNQPFRLALPPDTFTDANADPLNYTASQVDGSALPRWLAFDEKTITFSGTPGRSDTGDFSERIIPVRVTARDDQSRASTQFNINVQGTSNIALFLQIATPIATIFTGVFAAYQKRALCFNRYKKQRYQRLDVQVQAGEMFEYKFGDMSMQGKKVLAKTPRQLQGVSRFFLSPRERVPGSGDMPSWMVYDLDTNSVRSVVPVPDDSPPELIIQVKDEAGVVHEQFTLRVTGLRAAAIEQPASDVELASTVAL